MANEKTTRGSEDASRLKEAIRKWKLLRKRNGLPHTLRDLGLLAGGMSQSAVSQYANGDITLNASAAWLFANALGVPVADISPANAAEIYRNKGLIRIHTTSAPGMVYGWSEFIDIATSFGIDGLPATFSIDLDGAENGSFISSGEVITVSKSVKPSKGDVVLVRHDGGIYPAIYHPHVDGCFWAAVPNGLVFHSHADQIELLFAVVGMPTLRLRRVRCWTDLSGLLGENTVAGAL